MDLCYVPVYKTESAKFKVVFHNTSSLHKHFCDVKFEPNFQAADVVAFAETRLCSSDESSQYDLENFKLYIHDEKDTEIRPYHGLSLYIKSHIEIKMLQKIHYSSCELIFADLCANNCESLQVTCLYRYPNSSETVFKADIQSQVMRIRNTEKKFIIIHDFNVDGTDEKPGTVQFIIKLFKCHQYVKTSITDSVSMLDMVFSNTEVASDVIDAYWSDHKLIYCALDI